MFDSRDPVRGCQELISRLASLAGDPSSATEAELTEVLGDLDRLDAAVAAWRAAVVGAWDGREAWAADGALSGATWLAHRGEMSRASASAELRFARRLPHLPATADALEAGTIGLAKARLLANARRDDVAEAFDAAEADLVGWVTPLTVDQTAQLLRHWRDTVLPDGTDPGHQRDRCELFVSQTIDGMHVVRGLLDPEWGARLARAIHGRSRELRTASETADDGQTRPASYWRAAALVELVGAGAASGGRSARPSVIAVTDVSVLQAAPGTPAPFGSICEIDTAGRVLAETVRRLACDAMLTEATVGPGGAVLDLGRTVRTATEAQRKALLVRDQGCRFPGCDCPGEWTEAHHLLWWEHGGTSDLANLLLLCSRHHHLVHEGGFRMSRLADGGLLVTRPDGTTVTSPRPNHLPLRYPGPLPGAPPGHRAA